MKKSTRVALGGMISALCVLCLFMTGLFPFATYALPAIAGSLLFIIVLEIDVKWAFVVYIGVSILSFLITPDREAALLFVFFFGHYPVTKYYIERFRNRIFEWFLKFLMFNLCVVAAYLIAMYVLMLPNILTDMGKFGIYSALLLLLGGNLVFFIYDIAITRIIDLYLSWFRPRFLKRL